MRKIFIMSFLFLANFVLANIESPRYDDEGVHLAFPSWVTYSNGINVLYPEESPTIDKSVVVNLPETHFVKLFGKIYRMLKIHNTGKIELLQNDGKYDENPFVTPVSENTTSLSSSFTWIAFDRNAEPYYDNRYQTADRYYTVVEQSFKRSGIPYTTQVLFYPDGEVQIQLWNDKDAVVSSWPDWFIASFYDGEHYRTPSTSYVIETRTRLYDKDVELISSGGLRPGWIAKSLTDDDALSIDYNAEKNNLHVAVSGGGSDLGGIIAYDNSREHPVVGSFSSVDISLNNVPNDFFIPFDCWYFNEFYGLNKAEYLEKNKISYNGSVNINLQPADYEVTWDAYRKGGASQLGQYHLPHSEKELAFIPAPAFKFQRSGYLPGLKNYSFDLTSIKYHLAQLPSVQFLPIISKVPLKITNYSGGIVNIDALEAESSSNNTTTYSVYKGQSVKGSITAYPGLVVDKIIAVYKSNNKVFSTTVDLSGSNVLESVAGFQIKKLSNDVVEFYGSVSEYTSLTVYYKSCEKRELSVVPSMMKTEVYTAPENSPDRVVKSSAVFLNAFGDVVQTQKKLSSGNYEVTTAYSNDFGKTTFVPLPFVESGLDFEYVDLACKGCLAKANDYYQGKKNNEIDQPDAKGAAYSEIQYHNGVNGAVSSTAGIADRSFAKRSIQPSKDWIIPVASESDFISFEDLNDVTIEKIYATNVQNQFGKNYLLSVSRDDEGKYSQEIKNSRGFVVSSWYYNGRKPVISNFKYDEYGNVLESSMKNNAGIISENEYDAQGRLVKSKRNDVGEARARYDSKGRTVYTQNAEQKRKGTFSALFYDDRSRVVFAGEVHGLESQFDGNLNTVITEDHIDSSARFIYGIPNKDDLTAYDGVSESLVVDILSKMKGVRENEIGATISFENNKMTKITLANYNVKGKILYQWIVLGKKNFPAIQLSYLYDESDRLYESFFSLWDSENSGWIKKRTRTRHYNQDGVLYATDEDGLRLAEYDYTERGLSEEKRYYDKNKLVMKKIVSKDIYGRTTGIYYKNANGENLYNVETSYSNDLSRRTDKMSQEWTGVPGKGNVSREEEFEYDYTGHLTSMSGDLNSSYRYDDIGRMEVKKEGDDIIGFAYMNPSYRPSGYNVNGKSPAASAEYFKYDASGRVWLDKRNGVVYKNSVSGKPVKIYKYSALPCNISLEDVDENRLPSENLELVVDVAYDENGNRLWYSVEEQQEGQSYTKIFISGIGVFESTNSASMNPAYRLIETDLLAGGIRDEISDVARFPLTDGQGNVRGYATMSGVMSAYDYYPYGTVANVGSVNPDDGNKRWQNKEFDGEHEKYYFGSRYYDPFFAMWMSPDPVVQFDNPYTYGGDPINFVDPNGESVTLAAIGVAAAVGAIVGGGAAVYQCSKYESGNCSIGVTQGIVVGAAAGAAGAAVGGAAASIATAGAEAMFGGLAGGMASSAINYVGNGFFTGHYGTAEDFALAVVEGGASGMLSVGVGAGLRALGTTFLAGGSMWNPIKWVTNFNILNESVSSSLTSMASAWLNGGDIGEAGVIGAISGGLSSAGTSVAYRIHIAGMTEQQIIDEFNANNTGDIKAMAEREAVAFAQKHKGTIMASFSDSPLGDGIAAISGGGPLSHVRASDFEGTVVENNGNGMGIVSYDDPSYKNQKSPSHQSPTRPTLVTTRYAAGVNQTTVASLRGTSYFGGGMCVGAAQMLNDSYKAGAPNNLMPYHMTRSYALYRW